MTRAGEAGAVAEEVDQLAAASAGVVGIRARQNPGEALEEVEVGQIVSGWMQPLPDQRRPVRACR